MAILLAFPAYAAEDITLYSSKYLSSYSTYVDNSGTSLYVDFTVYGYEPLETIGVKTIQVQRSKDNKVWTTMKTYSYTAYPNMVGTGASLHSSYVSYPGTSGYYYRAYVVIWAAKNGVNEYRYIYTNSIKL